MLTIGIDSDYSTSFMIEMGKAIVECVFEGATLSHVDCMSEDNAVLFFFQTIKYVLCFLTTSVIDNQYFILASFYEGLYICDEIIVRVERWNNNNSIHSHLHT